MGMRAAGEKLFGRALPRYCRPVDRFAEMTCTSAQEGVEVANRLCAYESKE
jgi:hypothetical protein